MNPFLAFQNMKNMMRNPIGAVQQKMLSNFQRNNPQLYQQVSQMVSGKSDEQLKQMARNIASERGVDLDSFASNMGLKL